MSKKCGIAGIHLSAILLSTFLLCFLVACGSSSDNQDFPDSTTTASTNESSSPTNEELLSEAEIMKNPDVLPEQDPNADYIQDYVISWFGDNLYSAYTDSQYIWVKLKAEKNSSKLQADSWAAIDETGKIYSIIALENSYYEAECRNEYICIEEKMLYCYDGTNVTEQYLNDGETLLRITSFGNDFAIWKYQTEKKYQEDTVYTLRVCDTSGEQIFELSSEDFEYVYAMCTSIQYGAAPVYNRLSDYIYFIGAVDGVFGVDLSTGTICNIESYAAIQQIISDSDAHEKYQKYLQYVSAIDNVFFVTIWTSGNALNPEFEVSAYLVSETEPLYTLHTKSGILSSNVENSFLAITQSNSAWELRDLYTGELIYLLQPDNDANSLTYDEVAYSQKHNVFVEQIGDFWGVFSEDGTPRFEPIEGTLIGNWIDIADYFLFRYDGHEYEGSGLYSVDIDGNMNAIDLTGSMFVLNAQGRIMVFDNQGTYKLYDNNWNQLY